MVNENQFRTSIVNRSVFLFQGKDYHLGMYSITDVQIIERTMLCHLHFVSIAKMMFISSLIHIRTRIRNYNIILNKLNVVNMISSYVDR